MPFDTLDLLADPETAAKHLGLQCVVQRSIIVASLTLSRAQGTGLFTTGIIGFSWATLDQISPRASEIIKAAEEKVARNANNYPPGRLEQYKISLQRLKTGVGAEFVSFPGCNSQPSTFTSTTLVLVRC